MAFLKFLILPDAKDWSLLYLPAPSVQKGAQTHSIYLGNYLYIWGKKPKPETISHLWPQ